MNINLISHDLANKGFNTQIKPLSKLPIRETSKPKVGVFQKEINEKQGFLRKTTLNASVKQKFKEMLEEFDRIKYQSKKFSRKMFENDVKVNARGSTQYTSLTPELPTLCSVQKKGNSALIKKKKQMVDEKLFKISRILKEKTEDSVSLSINPILHEENKMESIKTKEKYYVLSRMNPKKENFLKDFEKISGFSCFPSFRMDKKIENKEKIEFERTRKNTYKNKNKLITIVKAIKCWKIDKKKSKRKKRDCSLQIKKKIGLKEIGKMIIKFLNKLKKLRLSPSEVLQNQRIFTTKPFEREGAYMFFNAVKENDMKMCLNLIAKKKYYIYDFNHNKETPLHLAVKYKYNDLALYFIELGADVDAEDLDGRTPLFLAVKENDQNIVKALLYNQANPWNLSKFEYQRLCRNNEIIELIKKARRLDLFLKMTPVKYRENVWLNERKAFE